MTAIDKMGNITNLITNLYKNKIKNMKTKRKENQYICINVKSILIAKYILSGITTL